MVGGGVIDGPEATGCPSAPAGFAAVRMFYMFPNRSAKQPPAPPQQTSNGPQV